MVKWTEKLGKIPEYPFSRVGKLCKELESKGKDIINARIGIPDDEAFPGFKERMALHLEAPDSTFGYPCDVTPERGIPEFTGAIRDYYQRQYGVKISDENIAVVSWTKDVLHNIPRLFAPTTAHIPDPVYPTYASAAILAGHDVSYVPTNAKEGWKPEFDETDGILFLCDPNNPTGAVLDINYYERLRDKLAESGGIVIADKAYQDMVWEGEPAVSITQIPGLLKQGYEVQSLSKSHNLVGIGLGWIVSSKENIDQWLRHASYRSQGVEWYKQMAGAEALTDSRIQEERKKYMQELRNRRDYFVDGLNSSGLATEKPRATPYLWIKTPAEDDEDFVLNRLIREEGVAFMPGSYFGECGRGYCRATLYLDTDEIKQALMRIDRVRNW